VEYAERLATAARIGTIFVSFQIDLPGACFDEHVSHICSANLRYCLRRAGQSPSFSVPLLKYGLKIFAGIQAHP
jgi:hypothetical protein